MNVFDPVLYSKEENEFFLKHLGEPTIVAMKDVVYPVNPTAVKPVIERIYELEQLQKHDGTAWIGVQAIKDKILAYLREDAKWERDHSRNKKAPRFPSLYSFDSKGRAHLSGPGSDSGRVRTYFGPAGERIPFSINLFPDNDLPWIAPGMDEKTIENGLRVDPEANRIECLIPVPLPEGGMRRCGHTESYKADSRASYNAARARMSKHLRKATDSVEAHRELHTNEFGE